MYGSTNSRNILKKLEAGSDKFGIYGIYRNPPNEAAIGTIVVKTNTKITSFAIIPNDMAPNTAISSNSIFSNASIGALFYIQTVGSTLLPVCIGLYVGSGSKMYQKQSSSGNLTPVDAWVYDGSSWRSLNT